MANALKCDRCHEFYEIPNKQQDKLKPYEFKGTYAKLLFCDNNRDYPETVRWYDLCPKCMMELECWLKNNEFSMNYEPEDTKEDNETTKKLCYFEYCKECLSLFRKPPLPGETGYSEVRCGRWHTSIPMRGANPSIIDSITPDMFIKGYEKEDKLSDPYEDGGL